MLDNCSCWGPNCSWDPTGDYDVDGLPYCKEYAGLYGDNKGFNAPLGCVVLSLYTVLELESKP